LSADNVLEWEIVTANGSLLTASPTKNEDLYWALTGGGPGTWGVVLSVTLKSYPEGIISGAAVDFSIQQSPSEDIFWQGVEAIHQFTPEYYAAGAVIPYTITGGTFFLQPLTVPNQTKEETAKLISGFTAKLDELKIPYSLNITQYDTWFDFFSAFYGPWPYGIYSSTQVQGSRLLPEKIVVNNTSALIDLYKTIAARPEGFYIIGNGVNPAKSSRTAPSNAVLPAWRDNYLHMLVVSPWDWNSTFAKNYERQDALINTILPAMTELAPTSGVYMNEGNPYEPDWKQAFFGSNYDRLKAIKQRYDPNGVFYAHAGVGSDDWVEDGDSRLCRI
jgi:FAD/FMN-containing dehydrogenase